MAVQGMIITQATVRVRTGTGGNITPVPFPLASTVRLSPSLTVTAPGSNSGTIYIAANRDSGATNAQTVYTATRRERELIKLTANQSFTFTGVPLGNSGYRDIVFGTGFTYIHASATSQKAVLTYYRWHR